MRPSAKCGWGCRIRQPGRVAFGSPGGVRTKSSAGRHLDDAGVSVAVADEADLLNRIRPARVALRRSGSFARGTFEVNRSASLSRESAERLARSDADDRLGENADRLRSIARVRGAVATTIMTLTSALRTTVDRTVACIDREPGVRHRRRRATHRVPGACALI